MFKGISLAKRIHIPIIFMMLLSIIIITINATNTFQEITKDSYVKYSDSMKTYMKKSLEKKMQISLTNAINISLNPNIINSLKTNNRNIAIDTLDNLSQALKNNSDFKRIKIHIHTKDTKSFLRHWQKDVYGDNLSGFRESLLYVKKHKKPFVTVESGRAGLLIRGIAPVMDKGKYLGSVEFIQGFNSTARNIKKDKNFNTLFLACREDKTIDKFNNNIRRISGLYLSQNDEINENLIDTLKSFEPKEIEEAGYMIKDDFFITALPIRDHNNNKAGCAIIASDISFVTKFISQAKSSMINQLFLIITIDILLLIALMYIFHNSIKKPIDEFIDSIKDIENSLSDEDVKILYRTHKFKNVGDDEIGNIKKTINSFLKNISITFSKLQKTEKYTSEFIKAVDAGSIVSKSDTRGMITYVNETLCNTTGYTKEELIGKPHSIFRHPNTSKSVFTNMWKTIQSGEIYHGLFKNSKKDGTPFYANITIVPIKNEKGKIVEYVALRDDVTELVNSKEELKRTFLTDPLTSFGNRFKLINDIETNVSSYLAILDILQFKEINDFYGYKIGDMVIVNFANRLFEYFKMSGYEVYRLNGDEFGILVKQKNTSKDQFKNFIEQFIEENKHYKFHIQDSEITTRITCGISYNKHNLVSEADIAHKTAKKSHKDILEFNDNIQTAEEYKKNLEWTSKIKEAINDNRIKAFFQPIVDVKTGKIEKYETLMRLIEKDGKEISPFFFLDIAKKSRLYKDLTKIVVLQAFEKFENTDYEFSINLSAEDIMLHNISNWFFELADEYKVNEQIVIELVESEGIESFDTVDTFIQNAKENGMKIAIDDFGTGYSNFEYLIKLNTDYLKIDGSLIKEIDKDEKLFSVVETIVEFAKKNNIKTIAEFIATKELDEKIKELDIDYAQGFYLGKPKEDLIS